MFRKRLLPINSFFSTNNRISLIIILALVLLLSFLHSMFWLLPGTFLLLALHLIFLRQTKKNRSKMENYMDSLVVDLEKSTFLALTNLPMSTIIFNHKGDFVWSNDAFKSLFGEDNDISSLTPDQISPELHINRIVADGYKLVPYKDKIFRIHYKTIHSEDVDNKFLLLYLQNVTLLEKLKQDYDNEKTALAYVQIDNLTDVTQGMTDGQRSTVIGEIGIVIADCVSDMHGLCKQITDDTYLVALSKLELQTLIDRKFDILDRVRDIHEGNKISPTLSIGMATGEENISATSQKAQSCLDLALGRGGDQAVLSVDGATQFFGGKTISLEKNTRVRSRIVAQSIRDLINDSDTIFVMGHANEDFDSIGAAIGVAKMAKLLKKEVYIISSGRSVALDKCTTLKNEYKDFAPLFINATTAKEKLTDNTLLFLVDYHRQQLAAAPNLVDAISKKVIIDHHRRAEDIIKDCLLVYLEPSASSTCELVTELLFYFSDRPDLTRFEASLLYAGIVLDTKNFIVQTGARTFEAVATLRRSGADPALVKQLFSEDFNITKMRADIISKAEPLSGGLLLSVANLTNMIGASVAIAQAADFLLLTNNATCSVVIAKVDEETTVVSARSQGLVNMQLVMEEIGGGGHHAVAGVQLKNANIPELKNKIVEMIQKQMEENKEE